MISEQLTNSIEKSNLDAFVSEWNSVKNVLTEKEKQELLVDIVDNYYTEKQFLFFRKVLHKIIDSKVSLNFSIDHWAPTFLSLSVHRISRRLFDFLLYKGADINFIADKYEFESEEIRIKYTDELRYERYSSCLDFAELKLEDMLTVDYNYMPHDWPDDVEPYHYATYTGQITIRKREYYELLEQSQYLHCLIHLDHLVDHIKELGGKSFDKIPNRKSSK